MPRLLLLSMDIGYLSASTACFIVAFLVALAGLRQGHASSAGLRLGFMALGLVFQLLFLKSRASLHHHCPITSLYEVICFVSWAIVMLYFVVGPAFRLSLLGFFTAPLVALFQLLALAVRGDAPPRPMSPANFWLELHASISLFAYGAFALACVAGVMYLVQDRQLRRGHMKALFYQLPSIRHLGSAITRLLWAGFLLLTVGIGAALMMEKMPSAGKLAIIVLVWVVYGGLLAAQILHRLGTRRMATGAVLAFALPVLSYWIITQPPSA